MTPPRVAAVLPSRDEATTIAEVTRAVAAAISPYFATVINVDSSGDDTTRTAFDQARCRAPRHGLTTDLQGKGIQVVTGLARCSEAADCILLADTDTRDPDPTTYRHLVRSILDGADLALAGYRRHWYEGNLTNHIARPLVAAVTGHDITQPIVGDIALSVRAARIVLAEYRDLSGALRPAVDGYGIDAFITLTVALLGDSVDTVPLDRVKRHAPSFPHLRSIFHDAMPVLLADSLRARPWTAVLEPHFDLDATPVRASSLTTMCDWLDRAAQPAADDAPWPAPLVRAWNQARSGHPLQRITQELWSPYARRVRQYLCHGHDASSSAMQHELATTMTDFFNAIREADTTISRSVP